MDGYHSSTITYKSLKLICNILLSSKSVMNGTSQLYLYVERLNFNCNTLLTSKNVMDGTSHFCNYVEKPKFNL
jgi:hypothetical protein